MLDYQNWPKNVPSEVYFESVERLHRQKIRDVKAAKKYHDKMLKLKSNFTEELHRMIGKTNMKYYKKLHMARIKKLRKAAALLSGTPEKIKAREDLRIRLSQESKKRIDKSDVDMKKLIALRRNYHNQAMRLFDRTVGKGKTGKAIPKPNNIDYFPPHLYGERDHISYKSESGLADPAVDRYLNAHSGDFGSRTSIGVSGADDWDFVSSTYRNGFLIIYRNPQAGLPALNIDLEAVSIKHEGYIRDECGYSDANVWQRGRLFGQVYFGGGEAHRTYHPELLISSHRRGNSDRWSETVMLPGTDFNSSFVLATPVPANTWILIGVGIETYNGFLSNDCGISSSVEVRMLARRIGVATTT